MDDFAVSDPLKQRKHPNYEIKVSRGKFKVVNFITATKAKDKKEFNGKRFVKIEADRLTD